MLSTISPVISSERERNAHPSKRNVDSATALSKGGNKRLSFANPNILSTAKIAKTTRKPSAAPAARANLPNSDSGARLY